METNVDQLMTDIARCVSTVSHDFQPDSRPLPLKDFEYLCTVLLDQRLMNMNGAGDLANVLALVDCLVRSSVLPNLMPALRYLPKNRSEDSFKVLDRHLISQHLLPHAKTLSKPPIGCHMEDLKYHRLVSAFDVIWHLESENSFIADSIRRNYSTVIVLALLQLGFAPLKRPSSTVDISASVELSGAYVMSMDKFKYLANDQRHYSSFLDTFLHNRSTKANFETLLLTMSALSAKRSVKSKAGSPWYLLKIAELLSRAVVSDPESGVMHLITVVVNYSCQTASTNNLVNMVSDLLSTEPMWCTSAEEKHNYLDCVAKQLFCLCSDWTCKKSTSTEEDRLIGQLVATTFVSVVDKQRRTQLSTRTIFDKLVSPIVDIKPNVCDIEEEISTALARLDFIYSRAFHPSSVAEQLGQIASILMAMHCSVYIGSISHTKSVLNNLVKLSLINQDAKSAVKLLRRFVSLDSPSVPSGVSFKVGPNAGIVPDVDGASLDDDARCLYVAHILESKLLGSYSDKIYVDFFLSVLSDLSQYQESDVGRDDMLRFRLVMNANRLVGFLTDDNRVQDLIFAELAQTVQFAKSILTQRMSGSTVSAETGQMVLTLLMCLTAKLIIEEELSSDKSFRNDKWQHLDSLLPVINAVDWDDTLAKELATLIQCRGLNIGKYSSATPAAKSDRIVSSDTETESRLKKEKMSPLIEVISSTENKARDDESPYDEAMVCIGDESVPVQGHGLISLARLLETGDSQTVENVDTVVNMCMALLSTSDSYIYLLAIRCLASCVRMRPASVVDVVTKELTDRPSPGDDDLDELEIHSRLAETLVRICHSLGQLAVKYKAQILHPLLSKLTVDIQPCCEPACVARASLLASLGSICQALKFDLHDSLEEVIACIYHNLEMVDAVVVKRAAMQALHVILKSLGRDMFVMLESHMRDLWRSICYLRQTYAHIDEALTYHASETADLISQQIKTAMIERLDAVPRVDIIRHIGR